MGATRQFRPDPSARSAASSVELFPALAREPALASRIVQQIEQRLVDGQLRPGDRLPSERVLSRQFGVSRTVVREAVHTLAARGLLEGQPGGGSVVCVPPLALLAQSLRMHLAAAAQPLDGAMLAEARTLIEAGLAGPAQPAARADSVVQNPLLVLLRRVLSEMAAETAGPAAAPAAPV